MALPIRGISNPKLWTHILTSDFISGNDREELYMKKWIAFFKYQFRYKLSSVYIILGMTVGFLALYNGIGIYRYIREYTNDLRGNRYAYSTELQMSSTTPFSVKKYLYDVICVVRMDYIDVYVDAEDVTCLLTVLISHDEKTNYHMVEGRLPNREERAAGEAVVAVGRGRKDAIYYRDGVGYILLEGTEYRVTGIVGTKASDAQDYLLITYYECLSEPVLEKMDPYGCVLVLESNIMDVEGTCEQIASLARTDDIEVTWEPADINLSGMTAEERNSMTMYLLLFGFTVIQSMAVAKFWIFQRKRDIAILRVAGYGKGQVLCKLIKEMGFHVLCSCVISALLQAVIYWTVNNRMNYDISLSNVLLMGAAIVLLSAAIVVSPAWQVMKTPPVREINGNRSE